MSHDCAFFATASDDSTVKVWDTQRLDGKSLTTRAKLTYSRLGNCLFIFVKLFNQTRLAKEVVDFVV